MKKVEKEALAKELFAKLKDLGVVVVKKGNWFIFSPPGFLTPTILFDIDKCRKEFGKLYD